MYVHNVDNHDVRNALKKLENEGTSWERVWNETATSMTRARSFSAVHETQHVADTADDAYGWLGYEATGLFVIDNNERVGSCRGCIPNMKIKSGIGAIVVPNVPFKPRGAIVLNREQYQSFCSIIGKNV